MLIKIDKERYINSDHIVCIIPYSQDSDTATVYLSTGHPLEVPRHIINYITQTVGADDTYTEDAPATLSLESRLAQFLRNQAAGQTLNLLLAQFPNEKATEVQLALGALMQNHVIHAIGFDNPLYYHASNPVVTGAPEIDF